MMQVMTCVILSVGDTSAENHSC